MTLEKVHWIDSGYNFAHQWETLDEISHIASEWNGNSITVGFVIYENEDRLVMVQTLDGEKPNASNAWLIYKENIISREVLG